MLARNCGQFNEDDHVLTPGGVRWVVVGDTAYPISQDTRQATNIAPS